jgi:hypothetical protein
MLDMQGLKDHTPVPTHTHTHFTHSHTFNLFKRDKWTMPGSLDKKGGDEDATFC